MRAFLILFGALNGLLYSSLLPLWEGFDEPFHYGYVQDLSVRQRLPVLGQARLSAEVWRSLELAPASHLVVRNIPGLRSFWEYFALPAEQRRALRAELDHLDPALRQVETEHGNYEAQQAPLAYALLAVPDRWWAALPLPRRIWRLRVLGAWVASTAVVLLTLRLAARLDLPDSWGWATTFLVLSTQMFWASVARIGNDWLAIPLGVALCLAAVEVEREPSLRRVAVLAAVLGVGLLTKAYFLALIPLAAGTVALQWWRRRLGWRVAAFFTVLVAALAGPWYGRNLLLHGSVLGTVQTASGLGVGQAFEAAGRFPWWWALYATARDSLWTGNNSFTTFSAATMQAMLLVLALAAVLWVASRPPAREILLVCGGGAYLTGMLYAALLTYAYTRGGVATGAWYSQAVLPALLAAAGGGLARAGRPGRAVWRVAVALWAYVIVATYWAKLLPLYGGHTGSARFGALLDWYGQGAGRDLLEATCLAPAGVLFALSGGLAVLAVTLAVRVGRAIR